MSNKGIEAVGRAALATLELRSALEATERVTNAAVNEDSLVELIAPATTDTVAAFEHLRKALVLANEDEDADYGYVGMGPDDWEKIARFLWGLLDDIDTLDDACKDGDAAFRAHVRARQKERWRVSESDGQTVRFHPKIHPPPATPPPATACPPEEPADAADPV